MAGNSYVTLSGPMFDGRAVAATHAYVHAAVDEVGQASEDLVRAGTSVFKHPTGHYASMITTRVQGEQALVTDSNAVYGPWLEGVGSRNATTRFKGYHFWRKAGQQAQRQAQPVAQRILSRFIGRMQ
jgi:hypothetical protein